jgi:hypothetical protein
MEERPELMYPAIKSLSLQKEDRVQERPEGVLEEICR